MLDIDSDRHAGQDKLANANPAHPVFFPYPLSQIVSYSQLPINTNGDQTAGWVCSN